MKLTKYFALFTVVSAGFLLASCNLKGDQKAESTETPEQIQAAHNAGREAARMIITREFADSMEFHGAILEAASRKARYQMENQPQCQAAYDSAFVATIRTVRPDLARQLE